jgi:hypothetical protein
MKHLTILQFSGSIEKPSGRQVKSGLKIPGIVPL